MLIVLLIKIFATFSRSWRLVKESFNVLKKDKEIMLFPILSGIVCLAVTLSFILPLFILDFIDFGGGILQYILLFFYYLVSYFVIVFFNVGLITCADIRLKGGDPTVRDGINNAIKNIRKIFLWALISATVGIVLRILSERSGMIGRIIISIIGMAWNLLTFFVIPVMIIDNREVIPSIKKSGEIFKKTWGETVVGQFSISLVFLPLFLIGILFPLLGVLSGVGVILIMSIAAMVFYWVLLAIIQQSLNGIFNIALYRYATEGVVSPAFSEDVIKNAFKPKHSI